ncbi:MAG: tetratricopeptide repeat protein, partial [Candidatus Xenobia bacterium]
MGRMGRKVRHQTSPVEQLVNELTLRLEGGDTLGALGVAEKLREQQPNQPHWLGSVADLYLHNNMPGLALAAYRDYLKRFPPDPQVVETVKQLEATLRDLVGDPEVARHLDLARLALVRGRYETAREVLQKVLQDRPRDVPARNNMSLVQWELGQEQEAILTALSVVEDDPTNLHALSNLVHFLQVCGLEEELAQATRKLLAVPLTGAGAARKRAEALTFALDDAGVVACLEEAERKGWVPDEVLLHLAAAAALRLGRADDAEQWWKRARGAESAKRLLQTPYAFTLSEWFGQARREALKKPGAVNDFP